MRTHAISKRVLSLMLALMLVLGMIPVFASAADTVTIYFDNTAKWSKVNAYCWDASGFMSKWPGTSMTLVEGTIYSIEVPTNFVNIIFNNGSTQTKDLKIPTDGKNLFTYSSLSWSTYVPASDCEHTWDEGTYITVPTCTTEGEATYTCTKCGAVNTATVPAGHKFVDNVCTACGIEEFRTVYFENTAGWASVNAYMWDASGNGVVSWPGDAMTPVAGDIWSIQVPYIAIKIIFNGGGTQTEDLVLSDEYDLYVYGSDWTTYNPEACTHEWDAGTVITAPDCVNAGQTSYTCGLCGETKSETVAALGHSYVSRVCTVCGAEKPVLAFYLVGYINGADYGTEGDFENMGEYKFVDGTLKATFTADSYIFIKTEGNANWYMAQAYCQDTTCTFVEGGSEKMFVPGGQALIFTLVENADGSLTLSYAADPDACEHQWDEGVQTAAPTCTEAGEITYTCALCGNTKTEGVAALGHSYVDGICANCGEAEPVPEYYLAGTFNGWDAANEDYKLMQLGEVYYIGISLTTGTYEFKITDGTWDNAWPSENYVLEVPADSENISIMFYADTGDIEVSGVEQPAVDPSELVLGDNTVGLGTYTFTATEDGTLNVVVSALSIYNEETGGMDTANPGMMFGRMYTLYVNDDTNFMPEYQVEVAAGEVVTIVLASSMGNQSDMTLNLSYVVEEPAVDHYLVGYINGADYGCNDDWENLGEYKFVDGTLVATFTADSYVFLKDNVGGWFLTEAYCTETTGTFVQSGTEKMFVPGNVEITFTLVENEDGSLTLSYTTADIDLGAVVSGMITSYLDDGDVTIELIQDGIVAYSVTVSGMSATYSIPGVAAGSYTMKVSKANHVALECAVVVESADVTADATICPIGDVNLDGKVNMKDWNRLYSHVNEVSELTGYALLCGDVNGDGKVNMKDWNRLYDHVNEIDPIW